MVPAGPRAAGAGRPAPTHWSSMPPVPKVALACPGRVHPWPMREACWSPAMPAMGGRPGEDCGRAGRRRTSPRWSGIIACGDAQRLEHLGSHPEPSPRRRPVTAGVGGIGDVEARRRTASMPPRCRPCRRQLAPLRPDPVGVGPSSRAATLVAEALGASRIPWPWSSRQVPTVRRSCQPSPGPTGTPVARSHTMVDARWLAMPTAVDRPAGGQAGRGHLDHGFGHGHGVELHQARGRGCRAGPARGGCASTVPSGRTTAPRTPEVPTSTTRMLTARAPRRTGRAGPACPG